MPEPGTLAGNLAKAAERVTAAGDAIQQKARDAAAQAAPSTPENGPGRPGTPTVGSSATQTNGVPR